MSTRSRSRSGHLSLALAASIAAPCPAPAAAGDAGAIVVTASRTGGDAAAGLATVTRDDVARLQPVTLLDALNDVAGVRAVSAAGTGGPSFVSIRGGEPNYTLVLIDGVRVNDTTNSAGGAFDFGLIDPALIRSVEISRTAASPVHGSDALSGVISLRLVEPPADRLAASLRFQGDTRGQVDGGATLGGGWAGGGAIVGASALDTHGADPGATLRRQQALGRARQDIGDYQAVLLGLYAHDRHEGFPEQSGGPELAASRARERGAGTLRLGALALRHRAEGVLRPEASVSWSGQRRDTDTPAIPRGVLSAVPPIVAHDRLERVEAIADLGIHLRPAVLSFGAAVLDERGRSTGTITYFGRPLPADFRLHRRTASGFAEATLTPVDWATLNTAVRYDSIEDGNHIWTARGGLALRPVAAVSLFARLGSGFKLPSFYALGNPLVGNPALLPERSRNAEAGAEWSPDATTRLRLTWFDNRFADLVDFDPVLFRLVNRSRVRARGAEAEGTWRPRPALELGGALTYLDLAGPAPLLSRPRWQGNVRAAWRVTPPLELGGIVRFNGSFLDSSVPTGIVRTAGHAELDLSARYPLTRRLKLDLALRNLTDARDWKAVGFPALGRTLRATLALQL